MTTMQYCGDDMWGVVIRRLVMAMLCVCLVTAQERVDGGYRVSSKWLAHDVEVCQVSRPSNGATTGQLFVWNAADRSFTYQAMPFDIPGGCVDLGSGIFLASGRDAANGNGHLVRFHVDIGSSVTIQIDEAVVLVGVDPSDLVWEPNSQRIFIMDLHAQTVLSAPWTSALPVSFGPVWTFANPGDPVLGMREPSGTEQSGLYLRRIDLGTGPTYSPNRDLRLHETAPGTWAVEEVSPPVPTISLQSSWRLRDAYAVPDHGPVEVRSDTSSLFVIFDEISQSAVYFGQVQAVGQWDTVTFPSLAVGGRYSLRDLNGTSGRLFSPSFRLGAPTTSGNYQMRPGRMNPARMFVGNAEFSVGGAVFWESLTVPAPSTPAVIWVWAAVEEPGPQAVVTVPTGEVLLANPLVAVPYEIALPPDSVMGLQPVVQFPMPSDPGVVGAPVLFQWLCFLGDGTVVVSDVFGSRLLPGASGAQQANALQGSGSGGNAAGGLITQHAIARAKARQWLLNLPCSMCPQAKRTEAMQRLHDMHQ